ncbi:hypothetical protein FBU59_006729, partial [Linderina macrospora]
MGARPQPHINSLGSSFMNGGPASLHLKRDPGFGENPMEEAMFDPYKQAYEQSSHFMLPVNSYRFPTFTPPNPPGMASSAQAGPSSRNLGGIGGIGGQPNSQRTPSGSSTNPRGMPYGGPASASSSSSGNNRPTQQRSAQMGGPFGAIGMPQSNAAVPSNFDPASIAQDLSSAYVSVVAGNPMQHLVPPSSSSTPKSANALGKSASHTPPLAGTDLAADLRTSPYLRGLQKQIRDIISSVWADTECGKSAGMAGVAMRMDDTSLSDDSTSKSKQAATSSPSSDMSMQPPNPSPSGDKPMDEHLLKIYFESVHSQLPIISKKEFFPTYNRGQAPALL